MKITFIGHSAVRIQTLAHDLFIDPFISGNPLTNLDLEEVDPSHIVLTHAHGDHLGDTEYISKRSGATVISSFEIVNYLETKGVLGHPMNPGGSYEFPFGCVTFTPAWHSSSFPDGTYGGMPMGVIIEIEGKRVYHAGDTALFSDMKMIGQTGLDMALLPIGDNFTMGSRDAVEAAKLLSAGTVVPIHYNTFELIQQDPYVFKTWIETETESRCVILEPGTFIEL